MKRREQGFNLLELLLALTLGLVLSLGVSQVAISARTTHASQQAAMLLQDDAPLAFERPISWSVADASMSLTLVSAEVGADGGKPDWTVLSDCTGSAHAYAGTPPPAAQGQIRFAIRQLTYTFEAGQLKVSTPAAPAKTVLVDNVQAFEISFGVAAKPDSTHVVRYDPGPADESLIRSVRILLTLQDPAGLVKAQTWSVVAALRNRLG